MSKTDIKQTLRKIIKDAFKTGHDQGMHEVHEPDFGLFYRNCWEKQIEKNIDRIREEERDKIIDAVNKSDISMWESADQEYVIEVINKA